MNTIGSNDFESSDYIIGLQAAPPPSAKILLDNRAYRAPLSTTLLITYSSLTHWYSDVSYEFFTHLCSK
jgi:hypothetical protein